MSMQITAMPIGSGIGPVTQSDIRVAATEKIVSSLPGNRSSGEKPGDIRATAQDLEHISLAFNRRLKFIVDQESQEVLVKVIDTETDKVIKVLPPEELQRLHQRIRDTIGFLFDQRV